MKKIAYTAPVMEVVKLNGPIVLLEASEAEGSTAGQGGAGNPDEELD